MSKNTGKKIKRIRVCKEKVIIYFFDKSKIDISHDAYASFHFFPNRELSHEEIKDIKDLNDISTLLNTALKMLQKSVMSEKQLRDKLFLKTKDKKKIDRVIKSLKQHDLINDKAYAEDFIIYAEEKKMGHYKTVQELIKRGISEKSAKAIAFKEAKELDKANDLLKILEKKYGSRSHNEKKQKIYRYLLNHGFSSGVATQTVSKIKKDEKKESGFLDRDFDLVYSKLSIKYEGRELFDKVVNTLRN